MEPEPRDKYFTVRNSLAEQNLMKNSINAMKKNSIVKEEVQKDTNADTKAK